MRHCIYCDHDLGEGIPEAPAPGRRHAYDPVQGRLWEICPRCRRWNPVPLALRWETLEGWEAAVRDRGRVLLDAEVLTLVEVEEGQVVRVGSPPPMTTWGGWRYGLSLPDPPAPRPGFLQRLLGGLPPPPLEGYDPYGLTGPLGGVAGTGGASRWLGSPFLERAHPLTLVFSSVPFAPRCPSCARPLALAPWDFHLLTFVTTAEHPSAPASVELRCGQCHTLVTLPVDIVRPSLRLGLSILDTGLDARRVGKAAGEALERVGGGRLLLEGLARVGAPLGDLGRTERVALGIALDARAEADALVDEWRRAEEITAIIDGELTEVEGFEAFRARILDEGASGGR